MGTVDDLFMERSVDKGKRLIQTMSKTIDDFRNFFKPNKLKERFNISEVINNMVDLIGASYQNNGIALELALDDSLEIEGYSGEFSQVILNIMSNAKDAFIENSIVDKKVIISSHRESNNIIIEISDNAGGIPKDIIQKIFDPYFSTKEEGKGTGIGLYMSKTIIETNMRGKLSVKNINQGVIFKITLQENLDY
jgi:signal transduction histidine kinase